MAIDVVRSKLPEKAPVRVHPGRLAALILLLIAGAFYVQPLRAFFAQQDRYQHETAVLEQARQENETLRGEVAHMRTRAYITRKAREDYQLVPKGMQAFVVKGLPDTDATAQVEAPPVRDGHPSVAQRLHDLWQTLRQ
jgi:cell division protein FtsB